MRVWRRFFRSFIAPRWRLSAGVAALATFSVAVEAAGLGAVLFILGRENPSWIPSSWISAIRNSDVTTRAVLGAFALSGIAFLRGMFQYGQHLLSERLRGDGEMVLRAALFRRYLSAPLPFLQRQKSGGLLEIMGQFTRRAGETAVSLFRGISSVVVFLAYGAFAFRLSPGLGLFMAGIVLPMMFAVRLFLSRRLRQRGKSMWARLRETQDLAQEYLGAVRTIRVFNREEWVSDIFGRALEVFRNEQYRAAALSGLAKPFFGVLSALGVAILVAGGSRILPGPPEEVLPKLALFIVVVIRLIAPMGELLSLHSQMTVVEPMLETIFDALDNTPAEQEGGAVPFIGLKRGVSFRSVSYTYPSGKNSALSSVSMELPRGSTVGVVGASGSGKTTLIHLLCRLDDPSSGRILVDGTDLRELSLGEWREKLAIVGQDSFIFHRTVRENLLFARPGASEDEIRAALRCAGAEAFVASLPEGLDTVLGERGTRLSGGQRQRIALARAFLTDPGILVLDEATSEVDAPTEQAIAASLTERFQGRTVLIIAHRLSLVRSADWIYVMDGGRVAEEGTAADLLARGGLFARIAEAQETLPSVVPGAAEDPGQDGRE